MARTVPDTHRRNSRGGYRLLRIFGIDLVADWSLLIIFMLVFFGLGASALPAWHPDWSPALTWTTAGLAGVALLASIALHELAHALMAKRHGQVVKQITLFIFGGVTHIEGRPPSPSAELKVAGIGPLVSLGIGVLATMTGMLIAQPSMSDDPAVAVAQLSPIATLLLWLGPLNIVLAVFNLLPGFPLDGGRVLRALLWRLTGDIKRATRWASRAGQGLAWALMLTGVAMLIGMSVPLFGAGPINGLWLLLIGWFLNNAARMGYQQLVINDALSGVHVGELVHARPEDYLSPGTRITELIDKHAMTAETTVLPVVDEEKHLLGLVDLAVARRVPTEEWSKRGVSEVMIATADLHTLRPDDSAAEALTTLAEIDPVAVVDDDQTLVGLLQMRDMTRWLAYRSDVGELAARADERGVAI